MSYPISAQEWYYGTLEQRQEWIETGAYLDNEQELELAKIKYANGEYSEDDLADAIAQYAGGLT